MTQTIQKEIAALGLISLILVSLFAGMLIPQKADAAAPVGASAVIQNSTATTVDVVITGTDFASFVNSGTTTAGLLDLAGITYNSVNPSSATTNGTNTITATFPISMGTAVIGNLTIDAGIVQDGVGSGNQNLLITIASGSITDSAKPVPISATFYDATSDDGKLDSVVVVYSEVLTAAADVSADWAISSAANFAGLAEVAALCNSGGAGTNQCLYTFTTTTVKTDVGDLTLTYTAGTSVTDGTNTADTIALSSGSTPAFTDAAEPVLTQVLTTTLTGKNIIGFTYSEIMYVTIGASSATRGDITTAGTVAGFGSFATAGDATVNTTKNSVTGNGSASFYVYLANINGAILSHTSDPGTAPSGVFTPVASAEIVDVNSNQVNTAATQTTLQVTPWDLTNPVVSTITVSDQDNDGRIDRAVLSFTEASSSMKDLTFTNADATLGSASAIGTFTTGTANDNTITFNATDDSLNSVDTSVSGGDFIYSAATTQITDYAGNLLGGVTAAGAIDSDDVTETDGASPIVTSITPASAAVGVDNSTNISITFSEAMDADFAEGTEFTVTPDPGAFATPVWTNSDKTVTLTHSNFICGNNTMTTIEAEVVDASAGANALNTSASEDGDWSFGVIGCGSSGSSGTSAAKTYEVDVTAPGDNDIFAPGDTIEIKWIAGGTGTVDYANLYFSDDAGANHSLIAKNVANTGSYTWIIPDVYTTQGTIRVQLTDLAEIVAEDYVLGYFTIESTTDHGDIGDEITAPSTGTQGISPVTGELEDISVVSAGDYIKSPYFDTVYYIDSAMVRHPFMDRQTYFTWQDSFDSISVVTDATLMTLQLGAPMLPKPGVVLVKIQSDARVYAVVDSGNMFSPTLRAINDEAVAEAVYGVNWADYIIDLPVTLFPRFQFGDWIYGTGDISINKSLMKTRAEVNS